jgi:hypothetical protein
MIQSMRNLARTLFPHWGFHEIDGMKVAWAYFFHCPTYSYQYQISCQSVHPNDLFILWYTMWFDLVFDRSLSSSPSQKWPWQSDIIPVGDHSYIFSVAWKTSLNWFWLSSYVDLWHHWSLFCLNRHFAVVWICVEVPIQSTIINLSVRPLQVCEELFEPPIWLNMMGGGLNSAMAGPTAGDPPGLAVKSFAFILRLGAMSYSSAVSYSSRSLRTHLTPLQSWTSRESSQSPEKWPWKIAPYWSSGISSRSETARMIDENDLHTFWAPWILRAKAVRLRDFSKEKGPRVSQLIGEQHWNGNETNDSDGEEMEGQSENRSCSARQHSETAKMTRQFHGNVVRESEINQPRKVLNRYFSKFSKGRGTCCSGWGSLFGLSSTHSRIKHYPWEKDWDISECL